MVRYSYNENRPHHGDVEVPIRKDGRRNLRLKPRRRRERSSPSGVSYALIGILVIGVLAIIGVGLFFLLRGGGDESAAKRKTDINKSQKATTAIQKAATADQKAVEAIQQATTALQKATTADEKAVAADRLARLTAGRVTQLEADLALVSVEGAREQVELARQAAQEAETVRAALVELATQVREDGEARETRLAAVEERARLADVERRAHLEEVARQAAVDREAAERWGSWCKPWNWKLRTWGVLAVCTVVGGLTGGLALPLLAAGGLVAGSVGATVAVVTGGTLATTAAVTGAIKRYNVT